MSILRLVSPDPLPASPRPSPSSPQPDADADASRRGGARSPPGLPRWSLIAVPPKLDAQSLGELFTGMAAYSLGMAVAYERHPALASRSSRELCSRVLVYVVDSGLHLRIFELTVTPELLASVGNAEFVAS
jgi:hypothetical protein